MLTKLLRATTEEFRTTMDEALAAVLALVITKLDAVADSKAVKLAEITTKVEAFAATLALVITKLDAVADSKAVKLAPRTTRVEALASTEACNVPRLPEALIVIPLAVEVNSIPEPPCKFLNSKLTADLEAKTPSPDAERFEAVLVSPVPAVALMVRVEL